MFLCSSLTCKAELKKQVLPRFLFPCKHNKVDFIKYKTKLCFYNWHSLMTSSYFFSCAHTALYVQCVLKIKRNGNLYKGISNTVLDNNASANVTFLLQLNVHVSKKLNISYVTT